jgi:SAM-dependent methyltransferase
MNIKALARSLLPPVVVQAMQYAMGREPKISDERVLQKFLHGGQVPWTPGYMAYKINSIDRALSDRALLDCFRVGKLLPVGYGIGIDERCVEYPWLFANIPPSAVQILDAGSVLNHEFILKHSCLKDKDLHILTLAPEDNCFWRRRISYLYSDLRKIPMRNEYYELVVCLSTLEHVGCDNSRYGQHERYKENNPDAFVSVMKEFRRVLQPGGTLLLSVPFGKYRAYGGFQQFNRDLLDQAISAFGPCARADSFYRYSAGGWQVAAVQECENCEYVGWITDAWFHKKWPSSVPKEPDLAAAARAVACVCLVKT